MVLKVFLASIVLIALVMLAIGIKLLFDKNAKLPLGSCNTGNIFGEKIDCHCGGGICENQNPQ